MKLELSNGEWTLMNALWAAPPMTIAQLTAALREETGWSKHTVITMLSRLEDKGAVGAASNGRAKEYSPILRREDAVERETSRFLDKVYGGRLGVMVNSMLDSRSLTREDIDELSAILERAKSEDYRHD